MWTYTIKYKKEKIYHIWKANKVWLPLLLSPIAHSILHFFSSIELNDQLSKIRRNLWTAWFQRWFLALINLISVTVMGDGHWAVNWKGRTYKVRCIFFIPILFSLNLVLCNRYSNQNYANFLKYAKVLQLVLITTEWSLWSTWLESNCYRNNLT